MILEIALLSAILVLSSFLLLSLLRANTSSKPSQKMTFLLIIFSLIVWTTSILITDLSYDNISLSLWASRVSFLSSVVIASSYYLFVKTYAAHRIKFDFADYLLWIPASAFFAVAALSDLILANVKLVDDTLVSEFGSLYIIFSLYLAAFFVYAAVKFYAVYKKENDIFVRGQMRNILVGSAISIMMSLSTNILLPILGLGELRSLGPFSLIFFLGFTYYSILRYRFLSLSQIFGKVIYTLIIGLFPYTAFFFIYFLQTFVWGSPFVLPAYISGYVISIGIVYLFLYFNNAVLTAIKRIVTSYGFNPEKIKDEISQRLSTELQLSAIIQTVNQVLSHSLNVSNFGVIIINTELARIVEKGFVGMAERVVELADDFEDADWVDLLAKEKTLIKEELAHMYDTESKPLQVTKLLQVMNKYNFDLVTVVSINENTVGLILSGYKLNRRSYNVDEIRLIESIGNILSVSFSRALLYKQVESFAQDMEAKVKEATREISWQKDELAEQLRKERDMMDILGHELRTPLSVARNAAVLIDQQLNSSDVIDKDKLVHYSDVVIENLRREIKILETVLSSTRIENDRLQIQFEVFDAKDVVEDTLVSFAKEAEKKGLVLSSSVPDYAVECYAGRAQTQEILDNFVSNAIKYTSRGSIKVVLETDETHVKFSVIDTGEGIDEEDIQHLGKKFYRAKMYVGSENKDSQFVRPGGTGIGLYVVFGLTRMMNGKIDITSKLGEGSTFSVTLPKTKQ